MQQLFILSMMLCGLVLCQGLVVWVSSGVASKVTKRFKPQKVNISQVPYAVHIGAKDADNKSYTCGGALLDEHNILTACHCVIDMATIQVRIGSSFANRGGKAYRVSKSQVICHYLFDAETKAYDVAIIKFMKAMDLKSVKASTVVLAKNTSPVPEGTVVRVSGWGYQSEEPTDEITNLTLPEHFGSTTVAVVSHGHCKRMYSGTKISVTARQFCVGADGNGSVTVTCYGDAGNPVVVEDPTSNQNVLMGIASYGRGCGSMLFPAIFSQVGRFYCWIEMYKHLPIPVSVSMVCDSADNSISYLI